MQPKTADELAGIPRLGGLSEIAGHYRLILCDVWGVLHNGIRPWPGAVDALSRFRAAGGTVVMVTNAPRQRRSVFRQLEGMGVPDGTFDTIVTSGDVTRELIRQGPRMVFQIGPERDLNIYEGLGVDLVEVGEAEIAVCTGLWDDQTETPEDYRDLLAQLRSRNLPMVCANPDIMVEVGDRLIYCAGALARAYEELGGKTLIAGKPHRPIYEQAIREASAIAGEDFERSAILAIGDGMPTDILGATGFGIDALFISAGIHAGEYGPAEDPDHASVGAFIARHGVHLAGYMPRLSW